MVALGKTMEIKLLSNLSVILGIIELHITLFALKSFFIQNLLIVTIKVLWVSTSFCTVYFLIEIATKDKRSYDRMK